VEHGLDLDHAVLEVAPADVAALLIDPGVRVLHVPLHERVLAAQLLRTGSAVRDAVHHHRGRPRAQLHVPAGLRSRDRLSVSGNALDRTATVKCAAWPAP